MSLIEKPCTVFIIIIIIIEHLLKRISLTVHQSSCRFTLIDMIINRHIISNMLKTYYGTNIYARRFYQVINLTLPHGHWYMSAIIDSHSIIHHSYADDLQLQMSAPPDRISELLHSMQSCISDVKAWATANMLKLNDSKTELMLVTSKRSKHLHNLPTSITIGNAHIPFKQSVKNLGFTLDCHLTMNAHVSNIARTCYYELRRLASIRRYLTSTATATLVSAFVLSRIDYCNSLLFGSTNDVTSHLQRIQNYAARVIFRLPMSSSITIHLKSLHWLPVKVRSTYKIACLCYHCHSSTAPSYVTDMLHKKPLHTRNTRSSSYTMPLLNRPAHSKATLGDRSFSFASSSVWNSIPNDVRCAPSLSSFKSRLKTYLFRSVYID